MKNKLFNIVVFSGVLISAPLYPSYVIGPKSLTKWLQEEFVYQRENGIFDDWKKPAETVKDKFGDCEDYGILVQYILKDLGYETHLIAMYNKKEGHAICIFKDKDGLYGFFDNQYYDERFKEKSIQDIFVKYYSIFNQFYTCNPNKNCKKIQ